MLKTAAKYGLVLTLLVASSCKKEEPPAPEKPVEAPKPAEPAKPEPAPAPEPAEPAANVKQAECVGPRGESPVEKFTGAGLEFERKGSTVNLLKEDPDDEFVVGQVSDVKDYTPENQANLKVILKWFKDEKVDAIAITGDLGETQKSIAETLRQLAAAGVPVLAIAGNRECREHFTAALDEVRKEHPHVVNMNQQRVFNTDDVSFVSLPGYYNRSYIHCQDGCEYKPEDVAALEGFANDTTGTVRVLLSHGPPKQDGTKALDRIHEEVNVGDPKLAEFLKNGLYPFGLFGNIQESGGYATNLAGDRRVAQGEYEEGFYLNPGPLDSVRWEMLDGTESLGMAGLLKIKGKQAAYKIYRIRPGEAKVEKSGQGNKEQEDSP